MSKGFAYTTFAVMAAGLIMMIVSLQVSDPYDIGSTDGERIGEAAFFLDSALSDADRTLEMATRRALTANTNYVVTEGEPLSDADENISEALVNGTMDGEELDGMDNASIKDWNNRVSQIAASSGYSLETGLQDYSFEEKGTEIRSSFTVSATLNDPVTLANFNRTESTETKTDIEGVEDPLITLKSQGRYVSQYNRCGFNSPAEKVGEGEQHSDGHAKGEVVRSLESENIEEKVFVTSDIDGYEGSDVEGYAGIVSEQSSENPEGFNEQYLYGVEIEDLEEGETVILNEEELWVSWFSKMFEENCYVETSTAPSIIDRLENSLVNRGTEKGLTTFINVPEMPDELQREDSAVDYVYFNTTNSYGDLNSIVEVSDEYGWFRLDDYHVEYWDIESLTE